MGLKRQVCDKQTVVYIATYVMYVTLCWEAIIELCENLQFGASLHLRCMGVGLGMGWVGSGSMKWTHGQLWTSLTRHNVTVNMT